MARRGTPVFPSRHNQSFQNRKPCARSLISQVDCVASVEDKRGDNFKTRAVITALVFWKFDISTDLQVSFLYTINRSLFFLISRPLIIISVNPKHNRLILLDIQSFSELNKP